MFADPFPPYWGGGTGPAVHHAPVAWPAANGWTPYTKLSSEINDRSVSDASNGGTSPQSYVNVSSGCTDQTLPSVYYAYDGAAQVLFFRWRVQAPPHTYATGPNPGTFGPTSPWNSALWTVFIDINGDGFRDFAVHLDGSSGGPATAVDRISAIWSATKSQSLDYVNDPQIHLIAHNPTAFVDGPAATNRLVNFHGALTPDALWPNGAAETEWDYGTTRATKLNTSCGEYFIDYQIPLAMLDATAVGGPAVTPATPMSLFFATANSLNNPLQKDVVVSGDFLADPSRPVPGGDAITPAGGIVEQPIVQSVTATGCGPIALTATVLDTLNDDGTTSVASVDFLAYADTNADGNANDGGAWSVVASGSTSTTVGRWSASWNSTALARGRYLIGARATDAQGHVTYSYLQPGDLPGPTPPHHANLPGLVIAVISNTCGAPGPSIANVVSPSSVGAGQPVTITVTITNTLATALDVTSITDALPEGFTYQSTTGGTLTPSATPTLGASGAIQWTFAPASIAAASTGTLIFTANAGPSAGTFTNVASAATDDGTLTSAPAEVGVGAAALTVSKTASVGNAAPGNPITYTIAYSNDSSVNATGAVITDVLPEGLDFVSASDGGSYDAGTRTVTWNLGTVAAGAGPFAVSLATTVASPYPVGAVTPIVNTATIDAVETSATGASSSVYIDAARARLAIQLDSASTLVPINTSVPYVVSYANIGQAAAAGAVITLPVPAGWSFVSASDGGNHVGGTVTWTIGSLAAGATGTRTVTLSTGPAYSGSNPSTVTATISATGVTSANDLFSIGLTGLSSVCSTYYFRNTTTDVGFAGAQRLANTTATILSDGGTTATGTSVGSANEVELVSFFQSPANASDVTFNGVIASNMWVSRSGGAPAVVTGYVYDYDPSSGSQTLLGSGSSSFNGNTIELFSFNVGLSGTLPAGHRIRWRYTLRSQNLNTSVTLNLLYGGGVSGTLRNSNSSFCVTPPASPTLDTQVDRLVASAGDALTYTVPFGNAGANDMTGSEIAITLPAGVTFAGATMNGVAATPAIAGQVYTFAAQSSGDPAGLVDSGESGVLAVSATITSPFTGVGSSLVAATSLISAQTTAITDAATTTLLSPAVTIAKAASDTLLGPGDTVTYTLDVLNAGPGAASAVVVTDVLPVAAYYGYVAGSARLNGTPIAPDPVSGGTFSHTLATLAAGVTARFTLDMQVAASGVPAGLVPRSNTATVSDAATSGTRSSNTVTTTISTNPTLTLTKTSAPAGGPIAPGTTITYTLVVTNTGSASASLVRIVDPMPASASYQADSIRQGGALTDVADGDGGTFDGAGNRLVFDVGTLAPGEIETFTYDVVVASPLSNGTTMVGSTALATAANAGSRTASTSIAVDAAPALSLVKTAPANVPFPYTTLADGATASLTIEVVSAAGLSIGSVVQIAGVAATIADVTGTTVTLDTPITAAPGTPVLATIEYRLDYANTGTADATGVVVQDVLPAGLAVESVSAPGGAVGQAVSWALGTIPVGESGTLRLRVVPTAPGSFDNVATLSSNELPPVASNTTSTAAGSLVVSKSTTTPAPAPGATFTTATYVIGLENQSASTTASGVTVSDILPAGFSYDSAVSLTGATAVTAPTFGDTRPTWTGLDIAPGTTATLTFLARINNVAPGTFQNEVAVSGGSVAIANFDALATTAEDVTVAALLGTTGVPTITASILPGAALALSVQDIDLDTDPSSVQTVVVSVTNPRTAEQETVTLTETGPATGVFAGTVATVASSSAGSDFDASLNVRPGDVPIVRYTDAFTGTGAPGLVTASSAVTSPPNNNPTAANDGKVLDKNAAATAIDVLGNDSTEPDAGETLTIIAVTQGTIGGAVSITGGGTTVTYQPLAGTTGLDSFTYTISDGNGGTATATVYVHINNPPTATPDTATVARNSTANIIDVLANDSTLPDTSDYLFLYDSTPGSHGGTVYRVGCLTLIEYTPAPGFRGTETFTYTVADSGGSRVTTTVTVTVTGNDDPTAVADTATVGKDAAATTIDVLANDSTAPDTGETLSIAAVTPGSQGGTVTMSGGGTSVAYTPAPGYTGTETFTYTVDDGHGGTATATVTVTVANAGFRRYFSEGLNNGHVSTHISLANPATVARPVHLEFYRQSGAPIVHDVTLAARSRVTIDTRAIAGLAAAAFGTAIEAEATVVAERTLSWNFGEPGTSLEHAVEASPTWFFAEGATTGRFSLFYLLMNPASTPATATVDFLPQVGPPVHRTYTIAPRTRLTIPVNEVAPSLAAADLGAAVRADQPIVVERSMYLSTPSSTWVAGTTGAGVTQPMTRWFFGEGSVGPFFDAWVLLANPGTVPATAEVRYLSEDGRVTVTTHTVPVGRRITIRVADDAPALFASSFGIVVTSTNAVPIVAERAMWWPNDGSGWYEGHVATGVPGTGHAWGVADGIAAVDGSTETYVLIANTSTRGGVVRITTVFDDGTPAIEHDVAVGAESRLTLRMRTFQPEVLGKRFSVFVEAQGPSPIDLVVEHSSYSHTSVYWGAGSSAPASPIR